MTILYISNLKTLWPGEAPVPPFAWRLANHGPVKIEVLYDNLGRQVFRENVAVTGKVFANERWRSGGAV